MYSTVDTDRPDYRYDHTPQWKKSLYDDRSVPFILTLIVQSIVMTWCVHVQWRPDFWKVTISLFIFLIFQCRLSGECNRE